MLTMRSHLFMLALPFAAFAACEGMPPTSPDSGAEFTGEADVVMISEEFPFSADLYLDCLDETVVWSGTALFEDKIITTGTGSVIENGSVSLISSTLVGPSGTWVDPLVVNHFIAKSEGNLHVNERITWTHDVTGVKMDVWNNILIVVTGEGDVKVLIDTGGSTCELRN
ncbi:MAG: hypothetical protein ABFS14_04690 [Gemmatimonadota bacterium]